VVGAGTAGFRQMRPRERRPDFKSRRNDAGESPGEGCSLDGTTLRRVVMFQYQFLPRFVALPVQSGRPRQMSKRVKGATFDLNSDRRCRLIPIQPKGCGFSPATMTAIGPPSRAACLPLPLPCRPLAALLALRSAARFGIRTAILRGQRSGALTGIFARRGAPGESTYFPGS
jgi:hypothetical protein